MPKKILIIDDEPHIIEIVKTKLEANDYKVISASNGKDGLEKVRQEKPDLVIVDILMPEMDGFTFVRELKAEKNEVPIIVLTSKPEMADLFEEEGIIDYLQKPFEAEELLVIISKRLYP